jgi:adenylate cyclase
VTKNQRYLAYTFLISAALVFALQQASFWRQVNQSSFDIISILDPPASAETDVLIVAIDDASFNDIQMFWPWPRAAHAQLLDRLTQAGARVVGFDLVFSEPSSFGEDDDQAFAQAIEDAPAVVLGSYISRQLLAEGLQVTSTEPLDLFQDAGAASGSVNVYQDNDGVLRRAANDDNAFWKAMFELGSGNTVEGQDFSDKLVRYIGDANTIPRVSYYRALDPALLPDSVFTGKIVLVGLDVLSSADIGVAQDDRYFSPFSLDSSVSMAGVEHLANMLVNQQHGLFITPVSELTYGLLLFAMLAAASWLFADWQLRRSTLILLALTALAVFLYWFAFHVQQTFVPLFSLLLAIYLPFACQGALAYQKEYRQRLFITNAFSKYVSRDVLDELIAAPEKLTLGGQVKEVTILFTDLANFTTISESVPVEQIAELLQEHLTRMSRIILQHGGTLDKYIGDAIMAFWGAPLPDAQQADHALAAALAMQEECRKMREQIAGKDLPPFHMRIGIHSGKAIVGNMGSELLFDYTCLGDNVNLAARLEGLNKFYHTGILVSEATRALLSQPFNLLLADKAIVKGKTEAIAIYTPAGHDCLQESVTAFELYARKQWQEAAAAWSAILDASPDNPVPRIYLDRIARYQHADPGAAWRGYTRFDEK